MRAEQGIGICAHRVEGDIAEIEQPGQPDDDVEAPGQHHVDQDLDAEIVDPFERALESDQRNHDDGVEEQDRYADPVGVAADEAGLGHDDGLGRLGGLRAVHRRLDEADIGEAAGHGDRHHDGEQAPALHQNQLVVDVLVGLEADEQHEQAERDDAGIEGLPQGARDGAGCGGDAGGGYGDGHCVRPFRLQAGRGYRRAGRSARWPGSRRRRRPCSRSRNRPTTSIR